MSCNAAPSGCSTDLPRHVSGRRLLVMCVVSLAAGVGVTQWLDHRGSISYAGSLQSRTTLISSDRSARICEMKLAIGQTIVPGDVLLRLTDDGLAAQIADKQRSLVEMDADLKRVKATADVELEWRQRELDNEIFQTQLKLSSVSQEMLAKQVEQLAWQDYIRGMEGPYKSELPQALLPVKSIIIDPVPDERRLQAMVKEDAAASAAESLATQLALCEEQVARLRKLEKGLPTKLRISTGVELMETRLARAKQELAGLEKQQESLTITSSVHGVVGTIRHQPGDLIRASEVVVELLDDERRHLIAWIPSSALTKMHPGSKVQLTFPGKQNRVGVVSAIPPHAIPADHGMNSTDSQVEVNIEPVGKLWPKLPVGSRVQVKVAE